MAASSLTALTPSTSPVIRSPRAAALTVKPTAVVSRSSEAALLRTRQFAAQCQAGVLPFAAASCAIDEAPAIRLPASDTVPASVPTLFACVASPSGLSTSPDSGTSAVSDQPAAEPIRVRLSSELPERLHGIWTRGRDPVQAFAPDFSSAQQVVRKALQFAMGEMEAQPEAPVGEAEAAASLAKELAKGLHAEIGVTPSVTDAAVRDALEQAVQTFAQDISQEIGAKLEQTLPPLQKQLEDEVKQRVESEVRQLAQDHPRDMLTAHFQVMRKHLQLFCDLQDHLPVTQSERFSCCLTPCA